MKHLFTLLALILVVMSCDRIKNTTRQAINKGGETAGKTATEFIEGVSEGVDQTLQCELSLSQALKNKGLRTGKYSVQSDTSGGKDNLLTIYLIFDKDFKETVSSRVFDKSAQEYGRSNKLIEGNKGDAKFYDFIFDKRTNIESKSKITLE